MSNVTDYKLVLAAEDAEKYVLKDGKLDLGVLIPMPEPLKVKERSTKGADIRYYLTKRNTVSPEGLTTAEKELIDKYWTPGCDSLYQAGCGEDPEGMYRRGKQYVENWQKYGHVSWRGWMQKNWGVPRYPGTYGLTVDGGTATIFFCADSEPYFWLCALAERAEFTLLELKYEKTQDDYR